ncbi:hypothetical protein V8G54_029153 [Vigna mungo]|uniref:SWIM-type domain-containing protein n=1 Tax=Vigna mungo TaxID=3915 RepID=A0AAQ3RL64_VIGMU
MRIDIVEGLAFSKEIVERKELVKKIEIVERKGVEVVFLRSEKGEKKFVNDGSFRYHGGDTSTLVINTDRWSYFEILAILKEMGYRNVKELWYSLGGRVLEDRLELLSDDKGAMHVVTIALLNGKAHLFVVHMVSKPDYIHMLQYDIGEHGEDGKEIGKLGEEGQKEGGEVEEHGNEDAEVGEHGHEAADAEPDEVEEVGEYGDGDGAEDGEVGGGVGEDVVSREENVQEDVGEYGQGDGGENGEVGCGVGDDVVVAEENVQEDAGEYGQGDDGENGEVGCGVGDDVVDAGEYGQGDGGEDAEVGCGVGDDIDASEENVQKDVEGAEDAEVGCGVGDDVVVAEENVQEDAGEYGQGDGGEDGGEYVQEEFDVSSLIGYDEEAFVSEDDLVDVGVHADEQLEDQDCEGSEVEVGPQSCMHRLGAYLILNENLIIVAVFMQVMTQMMKHLDMEILRSSQSPTYGIHNGRKLKISKSDKRRICVKCCGSQGKCPWYAYCAYRSSQTTWQLRKIIDRHTCSREFNISLVYNNQGKAMATAKIDGCFKQKYERLYDYAHELLRSNPGSTVKVKVKRNGDKVIFNRMCVFQSMSIIHLDGCFLKGKYEDELLTAIARDVENKETWTWFLEWLIGDLRGRGLCSRCTSVSDQQKGLLPAIQQLFPSVDQRFCVRHIYANFRKKFPDINLRQLLQMKDVNEEAFKHLIGIPPRFWSKSRFSGRPSCDTLMNNISEAFNSVILDARGKPIITMLEEIRSYLMKRWASNKEKITSLKVSFAPKFKRDYRRSYRRHNIGYLRLQVFEIRHTSNIVEKYVVDVEKRDCSCAKWTVTGIPCCHALTVMRTSYPDILPPPNRVLPGRPRKKRRLKSWEQMRDDTQLGQAGIPNRCGICRQLGHRRTNCPQASQHQHHQAIADPTQASEQQDHQPTPHPNQESQQEDHQPIPHPTQGSQITQDHTSTPV